MFLEILVIGPAASQKNMSYFNEDYLSTTITFTKLTSYKLSIHICNNFIIVCNIMGPFISIDTTLLFMIQPPGYRKSGFILVCELKSSLYGLEQSPRRWSQVLHKFMLSCGFSGCTKEYSLYFIKVGNEVCLVVVYVDDLTIAGTSLKGVLARYMSCYNKTYWKAALRVLRYPPYTATFFVDAKSLKVFWKKNIFPTIGSSGAHGIQLVHAVQGIRPCGLFLIGIL